MNKNYWNQCPPVLKEYFGYIENVKGRSSHTVDEYFIDLRTFFRYMKVSRGLVDAHVDFEDVQIDDIDLDFLKTISLTDAFEFMNYLKSERNNSNKTRARKTTSIRIFFRYLSDYTHQLDSDPVRNLETPKPKKALPRYLTLDQCIQLLKSVSGENAERDFCMLTFLLNCGLRRAELAGINLSDIQSDHTLRVTGKGNKERILYLNEACQSALTAYLKVRPVDGVIDKDALFLSHLKKRISLQGVHFVVKSYLRQLENGDQFSTHKLRHTAATLMYQQGGVDIRVLKDILGHENLGTTEIYTHLSSSQIKQASEDNPLSHLHIKPTHAKHDNKDSK